MDKTAFWKFIDDARGVAKGDQERMLEALGAKLRTFPPKEVASFDQQFCKRMLEAYTWDVWGAAFLMDAIQTEDEFDCFRCWLVGQGRETFEKALAGADSLADATTEYTDEGHYAFQWLMGVASDVYDELTGETLPALGLELPEQPTGEAWNDADLPVRFPRLFAKFRGDKKLKQEPDAEPKVD